MVHTESNVGIAAAEQDDSARESTSGIQGEGGGNTTLELE